MKGFHNLGFALGVCSGPKGPVIDLPIFGEAASSREGLGAPNPCPFGDRPVHLEGWGPPTLVHLETALSIWRVGPHLETACPFETALSIPTPLSILHLEGWGSPSSCPFGDRPVHLEGWGGPRWETTLKKTALSLGGVGVPLVQLLSFWRDPCSFGDRLSMWSIWRPPCPLGGCPASRWGCEANPWVCPPGGCPANP